MLHWSHRLSTAIVLTIFLVILLLSVAGTYLIVTPLGGKVLVRYFLQEYSSIALMHVGHYQGTLNEGFVLKDVQARGMPYLPGALARIQQIRVQIPLKDWLHPDLNILNARIFVPGCDTVVFTGKIYNGQIKGNLYAKAVDVYRVGRFLNDGDLKRYLHGFISNIDLMIQGPLLAPWVNGYFGADGLEYKSVYLKDARAYLNATLMPSLNGVVMKGLIGLDSGLLILRGINLQLTQSKAIYDGNMLNPRLDFHASAKVEDTDIHLSLRGTVVDPQLTVTSNPPLPPQDALRMLFTGNAWSTPMTSPIGKVSDSQLARNFLVYSQLNSYDQQRFGLQKKLNDRLKLGVEMDQFTSPVPGNGTIYNDNKVNGQMSLTKHLSVNVSQQVLSDAKNTQTPQKAQQDTETQVYLQYKKNF